MLCVGPFYCVQIPFMETFFLMRHGETAWNRQSRVMGRLEIPLNPQGREQAKRVARIFAALGIDAIYTSPLKRSVETALIVAGKHGFPVTIKNNLTELAFGRWERCLPADLRKDKTYHRFLKEPTRTRLPGGETLLEVQKRGIRAMRRAKREHPKGRLLLVTHGDVIRAILCHYLKLPLKEFRRFRVDNASLTALETNGNWAEVKFVNYLPDITGISKEPFKGLRPTLPRKPGSRRGF